MPITPFTSLLSVGNLVTSVSKWCLTKLFVFLGQPVDLSLHRSDQFIFLQEILRRILQSINEFLNEFN